MTTLARPTIDAAALAADFMGELVAPDHPSYDAARRVWNGEIQRQPALAVLDH